MTTTSAPSSLTICAAAAPMPVAPPTTSALLLSYRNCSIPVISSSPLAAAAAEHRYHTREHMFGSRQGRPQDSAVTGASAIDVYYDPFDFDIDNDPYPTWKRLRDEAPLYHNE